MRGNHGAGNGPPFVTVIIPCLNEEKFIRKSLDYFGVCDYPAEKLEVLVVDGMSEDGTREILKEYVKRYPFIRVLDNPARNIPSALNIGIKNAGGEVVVRMDAHSGYESDYISKCVEYLLGYEADNVGGVWIIKPGSDKIMAEAIALAAASPFGAGNAYYRLGVKEPKYVDTVPFGSYRRELFKKTGLFDEDLLWSEDDEFNARIITRGGKVLLVPGIVSYYYARESLPAVAKQYYRYAYSKAGAIRKLGRIYTWRQLVPPAFVCSLALSGFLSFFNVYFFRTFLLIATAYFCVSLLFSLETACKKGARFLPLLPAVFLVMHLSYGAGFLKGVVDFMILGKGRK